MKRMVNPRIAPLVGNDQAAHTPLDGLFIDMTQGRKRGDEFRMQASGSGASGPRASY